MDNNFASFLKLLLSRASVAKGIVSHIHLRKNDDGTLKAQFSATDGSLHYEITTNEPIEFDCDAACFGNLPYLSGILTSSLASKGINSLIETRETTLKKNIASIIKFRPNARTELVYVATDPTRSSIMKPRSIDLSEDWIAATILKSSVLNELKEIQKIDSATNAKENLITLTVSDDKLIAETGFSDSQGTTLELDVEVITEGSAKISINLPFDQFLRVLAVSLPDNEEGVVLELRSLMACLISETKFGTERTTIVKLRGQTS